MPDSIKIQTGLTQPTLFIGDLHIGGGGKADDFDEKAFCKSAEDMTCKYFDAGTRLIILGDLFELWQFNVWSCLKAHGSFIRDLLRRPNTIIISGNHDAELYYSGLACDAWHEGKVYAEHGHQADVLNNKLSWLGRAATWVCGKVEGWGWQLDEDWAKAELKIARLRQLTGRPHDAVPYLDYANAKLHQISASVYIFAHTHLQIAKQGYQGHIFANCGHSMNGIRGIFADESSVRMWP